MTLPIWMLSDGSYYGLYGGCCSFTECRLELYFTWLQTILWSSRMISWFEVWSKGLGVLDTRVGSMFLMIDDQGLTAPLSLV